MPGLYRQIAQYAASSIWTNEDWLKLPIVLLFIGFPFLVRGWIFRRDRINAWIDPRMCLFVMLWLALEAAGVVMQRRMYAYHFMLIAPPAALLFGMLARQMRAVSLTAARADGISLHLLWRHYACSTPMDRNGDSR